MEEEFYTNYNSPIGWLRIGANQNAITYITFLDEIVNNEEKKNHPINKCIIQLEEYFSGKRRSFSINLEPEGSSFQKKVWSELKKIPYGKTRSYLDISKQISDDKVIRAVGKANSLNRIPIIIPCHRVIGVNGDLTGYAGGLWRKKWLLEHESTFATSQKQLSLF